jgi:DNA repair exonuclease SbcCD ATPase subunit
MKSQTLEKKVAELERQIEQVKQEIADIDEQLTQKRVTGTRPRVYRVRPLNLQLTRTDAHDVRASEERNRVNTRIQRVMFPRTDAQRSY